MRVRKAIIQQQGWELDLSTNEGTNQGNLPIVDNLDHTQPGKDGEIQLTDALKVLAQREAMYAYNFEGRRYDVGDK